MPVQKIRRDINPQLCKVYNSAKHDWSHSWIAEPKFDGIRCNVVLNDKGIATAYSRNGKPLWNMDKILKEVEDVMYGCWVHAMYTKPGLILDGEVYTKDWNLSMSIVKRSTQTHPEQDKLRYHIWDCLTPKEWKVGKSTVSNIDRRSRLYSFRFGTYVQVVEGKLVHNDEELQEVYQEFLLQGYEGAILKNQDGIYECGRRSPYWLKIKPWSDADLKIVEPGAYAGEGKHIGRIGGLVLEGSVEWNGKTVTVRTEVGTGFTDEERSMFQQLWDSKTLIGKTVEIKFQSLSVNNSLRFPVFYRLRDDK